MVEGAVYGIALPLPSEEDARLRRWVDETPGATWPSWGGHITVVPSFGLVAQREELQAALSQVAAEAEPFSVSLSQVAAKPHAFSAGDWTAHLAIDEAGGGRQLLALRAALHRRLNSLVDELHPDARQAWYVFHVSLVGRASQAVARQIAQRAMAAELSASFEAGRLDLIAHPQTAQDDYQIHSYRLGGGGS